MPSCRLCLPAGWLATVQWRRCACCFDDEQLTPSLRLPGPLLVTQQLRKQGLLGGKGGDSLVANMTSKARRPGSSGCLH